MANRAGNTATSTEIIPAGHAAFTAEEEFGGHRSDTSAGLAGLSVAALGVVFGDIGTSPVYTFRECFNPEHGLPLDAEHVLGVLSMIFWALIIVVTVKYVLLIMRADNQGEGGILALLALPAPINCGQRARRQPPSSAAQGLPVRGRGQSDCRSLCGSSVPPARRGCKWTMSSSTRCAAGRPTGLASGSICAMFPRASARQKTRPNLTIIPGPRRRAADYGRARRKHGPARRRA